MDDKKKAEARTDGYNAGHADRLLGQRSDYAWYGSALDRVESYGWFYSLGYHAGFGGL